MSAKAFKVGIGDNGSSDIEMTFDVGGGPGWFGESASDQRSREEFAVFGKALTETLLEGVDAEASVDIGSAHALLDVGEDEASTSGGSHYADSVVGEDGF